MSKELSRFHEQALVEAAATTAELDRLRTENARLLGLLREAMPFINQAQDLIPDLGEEDIARSRDFLDRARAALEGGDK